jgi:hypothetical protein
MAVVLLVFVTNDGLGAYLGSEAWAQVVFFVSSHAVFLSSLGLMS